MTPQKVEIARAIFNATRGSVGGPVPSNHSLSVFIVTKVQRPTHRPLSAVRGEIEERLAAEARRRMLARFLENWMRSWKARTDCRVGYVVDSCKQHAGPMKVEYPFSVDL
jgi:hypothetical protein